MFVGKRNTCIVGGLGDAERLGRNADTPGVQHGHGYFEAVPFIAQSGRRGYATVLKDQFAGGGGADPQFWLFLAV